MNLAVSASRCALGGGVHPLRPSTALCAAVRVFIFDLSGVIELPTRVS